MRIADVRKKYLDFFAANGHAVIPSASLLPENDPTTLFTGSGMQPLVPYLLGEKHPSGVRLANSQKCFRSEDIEEVGDNRHTTFFEMLGNWSLGDYWKEAQLRFVFDFLTKELDVRKERLWATCFEGDKKFGLPKDTESAEIWMKLGIPREHIRFYGAKKNWWSRSGVPENMPVEEPGGPDSEVFFEFANVAHDPSFGPACHPNCDCGRFMEIGNSVFMEYRRTVAGFAKLPQQNVDFGGGLERITAATNDEPDIFKVDVLAGLRAIASSKGRDHRASRIIADHMRAAIFLISDGVQPSNVERGYFLRRLIRRAISVTSDKAMPEKDIAVMVENVSSAYTDIFGAIPRQKAKIIEVIADESLQFEKTLQRGLREFEKIATGNISGKDAFLLFSSYGFPIDMTVDLAKRNDRAVDTEGFAREFKRHQEVSRAGAEKKFKGGLIDTSEMSVKYHTATHLLHQALRDILGADVRQKGSNITPKRLRFDFSFNRKMTEDEKRDVERIINEKIKQHLPVHRTTLPLEEAKKSGALHFFDEKYPGEVLVHYIGHSLADAYSKEFCGGPHVAHTGMLGTFMIIKEEAVSAGVRRIKAILT